MLSVSSHIIDYLSVYLNKLNMITLDNILSKNLEMLKSQESELLKSLSFVQKAKQLFEAQWGSTGKSSPTAKKRGRPSGSNRKKTTVKPNVSAAPKKRTPKNKVRSSKPAVKRVSHLTNIMAILKERNKPMGSGELIQTLFKKQSADKNLKHFRLLIYPVLTKAYKSKTLKLKDGMISVGK